MPKFMRYLQEQEDNTNYYFIWDRIFGSKNWLSELYFDMQIVSPILTFLSTHFAFQDYCTENYP